MTVIDRTLADLADHPDATANEIAARLGVHGHIVFQVLEAAERDGQARRQDKKAGRAWRWERTPEGGG